MKARVRDRNSSAPASASASHDTLTVRLQSSLTTRESVLRVPMAWIQVREEEMKRSAAHFGIGPARWRGSLLHRLMVSQLQLQQQQHNKSAKPPPVPLLDPERTCALENYSPHLQWHPWLTTLIEQYYETGQLRVRNEFDSVVGYDILLALEFFGILYAPDQLHFDNFRAFCQVRHWSDYFTQRPILADWVAQAVVAAPPHIPRHVWAVAPQDITDTTETIVWRQQKVPPLEGTVDRGQCSAQQALADFFDARNGRPPPSNNPTPDRDSPAPSPYNEDSDAVAREAAPAMREDFAVYLQNILTCVHVTFAVKPVAVLGEQKDQQDTRALLVVDVVAERGSHHANDNGSNAVVANILHNGYDNNNTTNNSKPNNNDPPAASPRQTLDDIYQGVYADLPDPSLAGANNNNKNKNDLEYQEASPPPARRVASGSSCAVPVGFIDIRNRSLDKSVTSALTGPNWHHSSSKHVHRDDDDDDDDDNDDWQALRHEWIQGHLLNRGISTQVRRMLRQQPDSEDDDDGDDDIVRKRNSTNGNALDANAPWDWLQSWCVTTYHAAVGGPCHELEEQILNPNTIATASTATPSTTSKNNNNNENNADSPKAAEEIQKGAPSPEADDDDDDDSILNTINNDDDDVVEPKAGEVTALPSAHEEPAVAEPVDSSVLDAGDSPAAAVTPVAQPLPREKQASIMRNGRHGAFKPPAASSSSSIPASARPPRPVKPAARPPRPRPAPASPKAKGGLRGLFRRSRKK